VAARDAAAIRRAAAPGIRLDLGDTLTLDDLRLEDPRAPAWARLERALSLGCRPHGAVATATAWECPGFDGEAPGTSVPGIDDFERVFIMARGVALRAAPAPDAPVRARLTCEVVAHDGDGSLDSEWTAVRLRDGRRGFVASRFAHAPGGHRLLLERHDGTWSITAFLAGD
uniref:SH3 domain-containing protein n=1 Tax=Falsiroseomonas oryzae TaxID=2766473 RepID=UPI0022EB68ED